MIIDINDYEIHELVYRKKEIGQEEPVPVPDPDPDPPINDELTPPPIREGETVFAQMPVDLLTNPRDYGELGWLREMNLKSGDTVVIEMQEGATYRGRFDGAVPDGVNIIIEGNGAVLDCLDIRDGDAKQGGVEARGGLVPRAAVNDFAVRNLTILGPKDRDTRCISLYRQGAVLLENVKLHCLHHGIQGSAQSLTMKNCEVYDSGKLVPSGLNHGVYFEGARLDMQNCKVTTHHGHGIKYLGPEAYLSEVSVIEGTGNTGGAINWATGEGIFEISDCYFEQQPGGANNALAVFYGNDQRWKGTGIVRVTRTALKDEQWGGKRVYYSKDPPVTFEDLGGNTLNGESYVWS